MVTQMSRDVSVCMLCGQDPSLSDFQEKVMIIFFIYNLYFNLSILFALVIFPFLK